MDERTIVDASPPPLPPGFPVAAPVTVEHAPIIRADKDQSASAVKKPPRGHNRYQALSVLSAVVGVVLAVIALAIIWPSLKKPAATAGRHDEGEESPAAPTPQPRRTAPEPAASHGDSRRATRLGRDRGSKQRSEAHLKTEPEVVQPPSFADPPAGRPPTSADSPQKADSVRSEGFFIWESDSARFLAIVVQLPSQRCIPSEDKLRSYYADDLASEMPAREDARIYEHSDFALLLPRGERALADSFLAIDGQSAVFAAAVCRVSAADTPDEVETWVPCWNLKQRDWSPPFQLQFQGDAPVVVPDQEVPPPTDTALSVPQINIPQINIPDINIPQIPMNIPTPAIDVPRIPPGLSPPAQFDLPPNIRSL